MKPSFFALFKRGKYFHSAAPLLAKKGKRIRGDMREAERFAAAAVAFVWEHDVHFRNHFWRAICCRPGDAQLSEKAIISVEPHRWADLLIVNPTVHRRYVYVVECKINADLAPIQNPATKAFASPAGYGRLFEDNEGGENSFLRFIVFGFPKDLDPSRLDSRLRLKAHSRKWDDLANLVSQLPANRLLKDLALSLGKLQIGAFPASEVKDMKVNTERKDMGKAVAILSEVQRRLEWPEGRRASERTFFLDQGLWYFGTDLTKHKNTNAVKLKASLQSPERYLAWFGYQGEEAGSSELAIWLYCGSEEIQKRIALRLQRTKFSAEKSRDGNYFNVVVKATTHSENNDCDWFCGVFRTFGLKVEQ